MKIKDAFILAAGLGTRMGDLGKKIPKSLFPVFNKSVLEILVQQLSDLGVENIFINSHHKEKILRAYVFKKELPVKIIHETSLLGSGGAFYNLKKIYPNLNHILALNGDTVFELRESLILALSKAMEENNLSAALVGLNVEKDKEFNRLKIENGFLKEIIPFKDIKNRDELPWTFSGISVVNLNHLEKNQFGKESSFFETVANFKKNNVLVHVPDQLSYHDFGTEQDYCESLLNLISKDDDFIFKFLNNRIGYSHDVLSENDLCKVTFDRGHLNFKMKS